MISLPPLLALLAVTFGAPLATSPASGSGAASPGSDWELSGAAALSPAVVPANAGIQSDEQDVPNRPAHSEGGAGPLQRDRIKHSGRYPGFPRSRGRRRVGFETEGETIMGRPTSDIAEAATAALSDIWPDAEVRVVRLSPSAETAAPPLRVQFRDVEPRGRVSATVLTETASGWEEAGWAFLEVAVYDTVAVLAEDAGRGEAVSVTAERVDVTDLRDPLPPNDLSGWTARRSLRAGTPLTERLVEPPAAVESRAPVRVRYRRGGVRVTLDCVSRERGAVGETVRASCDGTTYRVLLTAPGQGDWSGTL